MIDQSTLVRIREVNLEDTEQLIGLYHELLPWDILDFKTSQEILEQIIHNDQYHIFLLEVNKQIIATCTLVIIHNLTHQGKPYGIIENVVTDRQYRGEKYGEILLKEVITFAKKEGCHKLMVQTRRKELYVKKFYKKCGFSDEQCTGFILNFEET